MSASRGSKSSSSSALKRLTREIQELRSTPNESCLHLGPINEEDLFQWEAVLKGPRDHSSPYAGGLWLLSISIPSNYPLVPPKITFKTQICHPNIHFSTGEICLTLLTSEHWTPSYTLGSTLSAIQQLLSDPGLDSPLNVDVANLYRDGDTIGAEGLVRFYTGDKRWGGEGAGGWISELKPGVTGGKLGEPRDRVDINEYVA
jgi:peroxin-4